jgi:hypothetical protein
VADVLINFRPTRHADPNESGVGVHFTFADGERAQFSRDLNRGSAGAANDLTTNAGTPIIGQGGGIYVPDDAASYRQGAVYAAGVAMAGEHEVTTAPAADRIVVQNGAQHLARVKSTGRFEASLNSGASYSTADWDFTGRGPFHWAVAHDGANQRLYINRTLADSDAVALGVPAGNIQIGRSGTTRRARFHNTQPDAAAVQRMYLRDFASRIVYQWTPRDVGEGPAGGILTGSCSGVGGWTCPLGAATMQFVWRPDLSIPNGGRLCLTDSQFVNLNRIDLEYGSRPFFGSVLIEHEARNPVFGGDSLVVGFTPRRGVDPTAAGSGAYSVRITNNGGGWWRTGLHYENGAQLDGADILATNVVAGSRCKTLLTRTVAGDFQVYSYTNTNGAWGWTAATVNNVAALAEGCITIAARGPYVERVTMFQGEATPHELGL